MHLTKHTDYALRALIYLASMPPGEQTTVQEIAARYDISRSHMMKIVNQLATAGLVEATRGSGGGLRLGRASREIGLDAVVALMETTLDPINCDEPVCLLRGQCRLKEILLQSQRAFLANLARYTLADLASPAGKAAAHLTGRVMLPKPARSKPAR